MAVTDISDGLLLERPEEAEQVSTSWLHRNTLMVAMVVVVVTVPGLCGRQQA
jgi:hypothetical protein